MINLILNQDTNRKFNLTETDFKQVEKRFKRVYDINDIEPEFFEDDENIVDFLLNKYSVPTILQSLKYIILLSEFKHEYAIKIRYQAHYEMLLDMKINSNLYSKASYFQIDKFVDDKYLKFLGGGISFSKFRHFLLLTFLIKELPLRYTTLTNIHYKYHSFIEGSDCLEHSVYLVNKNSKFIMYFNKFDKNRNKIQIKYKLQNEKVRMLLVNYFALYANNLNYVFTTSGGRKCTESNMANSLSNFCRQHFRLPMSLTEIREDWLKLPQPKIKTDIIRNF
jgi:hypothetical protein